jgi:hypothetical protein
VRRSIPVVVIALAALAVTGAYAKPPAPPPDGAWELRLTRATYEGPAAPVRSILANVIQKRVVFSPVCTEHWCTVDVTVMSSRGRRVTFTLAPTNAWAYSGWVALPTGLRCGGRKLPAMLTMTVKVVSRQEEPADLLTGTTEAFISNPGRCALFRGKAWGIRRAWYYGVAVSG